MIQSAKPMAKNNCYRQEAADSVESYQIEGNRKVYIITDDVIQIFNISLFRFVGESKTFDIRSARLK